MSNEEAQTTIMELFEQLLGREEEIKELREEMKDAISQFCEQYDQFEVKQIKEGFRFFKKLAKDKSSTMDMEFQRDKIVELLIGDTTV